MYLSWAAFYEGHTDREYFDVLIPRVLQDAVAHARVLVEIPESPSFIAGSRNRNHANIAAEACRGREAFHIFFVHGDVGGAGQAQGIYQRTTNICREMHILCQHRCNRCVALTPRHETEAWALADYDAVVRVIPGLSAITLGNLPRGGREAERLVDPKAILQSAVRNSRGQRRREIRPPLAALARIQSLAELRRMETFADFERDVRSAVRDLGIT